MKSFVLLPLIKSWKYLEFASPSLNHWSWIFCLRIEFQSFKYLIYSALIPWSLDLFSSELLFITSSSAILTFSSYFFTMAKISPYSVLDQLLRVEVNLFIFWWKLHIGLPEPFLFQQAFTISIKFLFSTQQCKNLKYLEVVSCLTPISIRRRLWSDPTEERYVIVVWGMSSNHWALSSLYHTLACPVLWLHQVKCWSLYPKSHKPHASRTLINLMLVFML